MHARTKRLFAQLAMTAIASSLLMMLAYEVDGTKCEWLAIPIYGPGFFAAAMVFPGGAHAEGFVRVALGMGLAFNWIILLLVVKLVEIFITRLKRKAAN